MRVIPRCCGVVVTAAVLLWSPAQQPAFAQSETVRAEAWIGLARVERDAGRPQAAARAFRAAGRLRVLDEPLLVEFFWIVAEVDAAEAAAVGRQALALNPANGDVRDHLIELASRAGTEAGALALAADGARAEPDRALWHRRMGESLLRSGAPARAAEAFARVLETAEAEPADAAQRALALETAGLWADAWRAWVSIDESVWASRPEWVHSRFRALGKSRTAADVAPRIARHLSTHAPDPELRAQLVETWAEAGRAKLARDALATLLVGPARVRWLRRAVDLNHAAGDLPRAVQALDALRRAGGTRQDDLWRMAAILADMGELERVLSMLGELRGEVDACAEEPLDILGRLSDPLQLVEAVRSRPSGCARQTAWIERAARRAAAAELHHVAREMLELPIIHIERGTLEQRELYGQLLLWTGEPRRAIPVLEQVLPRVPDGAAAARALIDALRAVGRLDEAWRLAHDRLGRDSVTASQQLTWAEVALEAGHAGEALSLAERLSADPDVGERARLVAGRALFGLSRPAEARDALRVTLPVEPDPPTILALVDAIAMTEGIEAALEEVRQWRHRDLAWRDVNARRALWEHLVGDRTAANRVLTVLQSNDARRAHLLRAEIALAEWRGLDAEQILLPLVRDHPGDALGLDLLSAALARQRRWDDALAVVEDLEAQRPGEIAWRIRRAELIYYRAPSPSTLQALEDLVRQHPRRFDARLALAGCYAEAGQPERVLTLLGGSVSAWSTLPEPQRGLVARLLRELDRRAEALDVLEAARLFALPARLLRAELLAAEHGPAIADAEFAVLAQDPRADASLFLVWASAQADARRLAILERGWKRFPADPGLTEALAVRRWAAGDANGALEAAEQVLAYDDSRSQAWFITIEAVGQLQPARDLADLLDRFETRFATEPSVMLAMADLLSSRSQIGDTRAVETALRWTERLRETDHEQIPVLLTQARLHGALGHWDDALGIVDQILRVAQENLVALEQRAALLSNRGHYSDAVAAYDVYLALAPNDLAARRQQARIEGWRQAHRAALRRYARLLEDAPTAEAIRAEAAAKRAFFGGRWERAIAAYGRWLALEPDETEARFELAQAYDRARRPALAERTYVELLSHLPLHRQAQVARERLEQRRVLAVHAFAEGQSERGYQGQRLLDRFDRGLRISNNLGGGLATQFSVRGAFTEVGAGRERFTGHLAAAEISRFLGADWLVTAQGGQRRYPGLGADATSGHAALSWWPADILQASAGFDRAPLMENLETLRHNIIASGPFASLTYEPTTAWRFAARAAWGRLTDHNRRRIGRIEVARRLTGGRTGLRVLASAEHLAYRTATSLYFWLYPSFPKGVST